MNSDPNDVFRSALESLKSELGAAHRPRRWSVRHNGVTAERVEAALARLQQGTFGYCRRCFLTIPQAELLRRPYAECCGPCQARKESRPPILLQPTRRVPHGIGG